MLRKQIRGIVIDAGNGGRASVATGNGLVAKNLTLEISRYIYDRLKQLNIPVSMTRDSDVTLSDDERVQRALNAFGRGSDVIILSNRVSSGKGEGAETIYALRNNDTLAKSISEALEGAGQTSRKYYQRRWPENPLYDYDPFIRNTENAETLIVEYGSLDNQADATKLKNNLEAYAEAVVRALANYAGVTYIPPNGSIEDIYTVQKGDSLWSIANKFGVTVEELKSANNLSSNTLQIGQVLVIPREVGTSPGSYITYTVQSGDSLYKIATRYETTVQEIIDANGLTSTVLSIGQQLKIPTVGGTPSLPPTTEQTTYIVKKGDSLWSIANQFGVTVDDILKINNLSSSTLQIGQELRIPSSSSPSNPSQTKNYTVQKGDSLWTISRKYNVSVDDIIRANNLSSSSLQIGQVLKIPTTSTTPTQPTYRTYTVQKGDSLWTIANKYGKTVSEIQSLNNLTSNTLQIGQVLKIPN